MNVGISINSQNGEDLQSYHTDGDLNLTQDGFILTYKLGEDENRLVYNGKSIRQSRSGGFTYSVEFISDKKCSFLFNEMGYNFSHEVDVLCVFASQDNSGCVAKIIYTDCENVTAIYIKAEYKNH